MATSDAPAAASRTTAGIKPQALPRVSAPGLALEPCTASWRLDAPMPQQVGEALRYTVDVNGVGVGTIDFKIQRQGQYAGRAVTEYRSLFNLDALVAALIPSNGRATALVRSQTAWPTVALSHYTSGDHEIEEKTTFSDDGHDLALERTKDGNVTRLTRHEGRVLMDFVTAFYRLRTLQQDHVACGLVFGNERLYTFYITPEGADERKTPVGIRPAWRYGVRYASDKFPNLVITGTLWTATDATALPYEVELMGARHVEARLHTYQPATVGPAQP